MNSLFVFMFMFYVYLFFSGKGSFGRLYELFALLGQNGG